MARDPAVLWETSYSVTRILSESDQVGTALSAVLRLIASRFGFGTAGFWRVDYEQVLLRCSEFWNLQAGRFQRFEAVSRARTFSIGEGLPGRVWQSREPCWIADVTIDNNFPRASVARLDGLHSGVAFPILHRGRVLGVMEFFTEEVREPDRELLDFLLSVGSQVGLFLERLQAEESLTGAESQFQVLAERAVDGIITIDEKSTILFANPAAARIFGYEPGELRGKPLTFLMPDYLRHVHEHGLRRYVETGVKHLNWDGVELPGLHKDGSELKLEIAFGEFMREGKRLFSGYVRKKKGAQATAAPRRA